MGEMKFLIIVLMFFLIAAFLIIGNNNLALYQEGNFGKFFGLYFDWLDKVFGNTQKITGEAVKLEWLP